ncbi:MAG: serine/threonine protein kinase [Polyangiaceae bacterium]|nr:serine/threonine protein kinase [Polyangiaceae bacterium]
MSDAHQQQRYRVLERLAAGGMAEVFIAESAGIEGFKKRVAIKRVLPHLSEKKRFISMFLDEARLSAQLNHSNCVQVFDIGVGDNAYFIVMEYVDGSDLKAVVDYLKNSGRTFPVEIGVLIAIRICEGLTYAHELTTAENKPLEIVHRDMSPPNVLITKHGEVKIVDFGLAKATSQLEKSEPGIIKGKFSYLSPEAALGGEVGLQTDIFAVGIILWELLAGKRLFLGETDFSTVKMVQQAQIPSLKAMRGDVPEELERIIGRSMAKDLNVRYRSARDLGRDLTAFLYRYGKPVSSFDIAELVRGAMSQRKLKKPDKASIIDKLIDEALLEFTSLQDKDKGPVSASPPKADDPLKLGFENIGGWIDEVNARQTASLPPSDSESQIRASIHRATMDIGLGNLAALEDEGGSPPPPGAGISDEPSDDVVVRGTAPHAGSTGGSVRPVLPSQSMPTSVRRGDHSLGKQGMNPIVYVLLVLLVGGAVAGAWFAGIIPH